MPGNWGYLREGGAQERNPQMLFIKLGSLLNCTYKDHVTNKLPKILRKKLRDKPLPRFQTCRWHTYGTDPINIAKA